MKRKGNIKDGKYCKGCAWLHIGEKVDHNHCDYFPTSRNWDDLGRRANGNIEYCNGKLSSHYEQCKWFWDKNINPNPSKSGYIYKAPKSNKCPKIPITHEQYLATKK